MRARIWGGHLRRRYAGNRHWATSGYAKDEPGAANTNNVTVDANSMKTTDRGTKAVFTACGSLRLICNEPTGSRFQYGSITRVHLWSPYRASGHHFTRPVDYEVTNDKATHLLANFPHLFSPVTEATATARQRWPSRNPRRPTSPSDLYKANRGQREAIAATGGLEVKDEMDTDATLRSGIEDKLSKQIG